MAAQTKNEKRSCHEILKTRCFVTHSLKFKTLKRSLIRCDNSKTGIVLKEQSSGKYMTGPESYGCITIIIYFIC